MTIPFRMPNARLLLGEIPVLQPLMRGGLIGLTPNSDPTVNRVRRDIVGVANASCQTEILPLGASPLPRLFEIYILSVSAHIWFE